GDHLLVAHAAAGLDQRRGARLGEHVHAVAERKERIRRYGGSGERELRALRFQRGDAHAVDAAHLASTDAERGTVAGEDDRIGLYEFGDAPGEREIAPLRFARCFSRHHAQLAALHHAAIRSLHEQPAADALVVVRLVLARERHFEQAQVGLAFQYFQGIGRHARRDDDLGELLAERLRRAGIERAIETEDAAERRDRIGGERALIRRLQRGAG